MTSMGCAVPTSQFWSEQGLFWSEQGVCSDHFCRRGTNRNSRRWSEQGRQGRDCPAPAAVFLTQQCRSGQPSMSEQHPKVERQSIAVVPMRCRRGRNSLSIGTVSKDG